MGWRARWPIQPARRCLPIGTSSRPQDFAAGSQQAVRAVGRITVNPARPRLNAARTLPERPAWCLAHVFSSPTMIHVLLHKPFEMRELEAVVEQLLAEHAARR
jgi:hypothetical protein